MLRTRTSRAIAAIAAGALTGGVLVGGTAHAAKPATQACLGQFFSAAEPGAVGPGVRIFATTTDFGLGDEIQFLQAGLVPDELFENTCND